LMLIVHASVASAMAMMAKRIILLFIISSVEIIMFLYT
jgi:hypothetical protein